MQSVERCYYNDGCVLVNVSSSKAEVLWGSSGWLLSLILFPILWISIFHSPVEAYELWTRGQNDRAYAVLKANILVCFIGHNPCKASHGQMEIVSETSSVWAVFETSSIYRPSHASRQCILMKSWSWCVLRLSCSVLSIIDWFLVISKVIQFCGKNLLEVHIHLYMLLMKKKSSYYTKWLCIPLVASLSCRLSLSTFEIHIKLK